jgi:hypothetical protein
MTPNPKYKPLTEAQFRSQWKTYLAGNPDVRVEFGNTFDDAWFHYSFYGVNDIQSGFRKFGSQTPELIRDFGLRYPTEFGLIDPKTGRRTEKFIKNLPEEARQHLIDNYEIYDESKGRFTQADLDFLKARGVTDLDQISRIADRFDTDKMDLATASKFRTNDVLGDPEKYKLIDPKTGKHTANFMKFLPEQARQYIAENYTEKYDTNKGNFTGDELSILTGAKLSEDQIRQVLGNYELGGINSGVARKYIADQYTSALSPESYKQFFDTGAKATPLQAKTGAAGIFDANDLAFLREQKVPAEQIAEIARSYGIGSIRPDLLKYNANTKKYATPELSPIAGDIFADYGKFEVGQQGIFDQADVNLLKSLGYTDADISNRARTLFGEDRVSSEVIQQYFPNLALQAPGSLYVEQPIQFDRTPQTVRPPDEPIISGRPVEPTQPTVTAPTIQAPAAPVAPTVPETDYYSFFRGIPGPETAAAAAPAPVQFMTGPAARNPVIDYFANTPIATPFPTLPYRFQTLTPENVNLRQGLGTLPTTLPLLQGPGAPAPVASPFPTTPPGSPNLPISALQYIAPAPTVAELQAALAAQALVSPTAPVPAGVVAEAPVTAPVTGRMGGMVSFAEGGMPRFAPAEVGSEFNVQDYIDPNTGRFYINEFQRDQVFNPQLRQAEEQARSFKEGGVASLSLPEMAEKVRSAGRGEDTVLAHITPEEAGILKLLGGSGTINPKTGQPEFLKKFIKKVVPKEIYKPISSAGKKIERGIESIADKLGPVGQIAAAHFLGPIGAGIYAGLAPKGSSFDVKRAAIAAAATKIAKDMFPPGAESTSGVESAAGTGGPYDISDVGSLGDLSPPATVPSVDVAALPTSQISALEPTTSIGADVGEYYQGPGAAVSGATPPPPPTYLEEAVTYISEAPGRVIEGVQNLPQTIADLPGNIVDYAVDKPIQTAFIGSQLYAAKEAKNEMEKYEEEQRRLEAEEEERRRRYGDLFSRTLGRVPMAGGGIIALNRGGMPTFEYGGTTAPTGEPRMVRGAGDGMSDNVPATIEGVQEARLANDEFVVPADVVADIGNGSSNSGAKKLYAMMDRVRKARHGTTKQPPEINAERLMPA